MRLTEFVSVFRDFVDRCEDRITGPGAEQYQTPEGDQKFEQMDLDTLFDWAEEELQDVAVYAAMLAIRLRRLKEVYVGAVFSEEKPVRVHDHAPGIDLRGPAWGKRFDY